MAFEDPLAGPMAEGPGGLVGLELVERGVVGQVQRITLSKSQPWATLYQPMKRIPNFSSYSCTWRGKIVRMKNLKNGSRPRRTEK